ncbi:hypothetical protein BH24CHL7_BH24CHL7_17180 [soil metagenome]
MTDIRFGPFGPFPWIDLVLLGWFALVAISVAYWRGMPTEQSRAHRDEVGLGSS